MLFMHHVIFKIIATVMNMLFQLHENLSFETLFHDMINHLIYFEVTMLI